MTQEDLNASTASLKVDHFVDVINSFHTSILFQYPLKSVRKPMFFGFFRGYRTGTLAQNGVKLTL